MGLQSPSKSVRDSFDHFLVSPKSYLSISSVSFLYYLHVLYNKGRPGRDRMLQRNIVMCTTYKIYTEILRNKIEAQVEDEGMLPKSQTGFRNILNILIPSKLNTFCLKTLSFSSLSTLLISHLLFFFYTLLLTSYLLICCFFFKVYFTFCCCTCSLFYDHFFTYV